MVLVDVDCCFVDMCEAVVICSLQVHLKTLCDKLLEFSNAGSKMVGKPLVFFSVSKTFIGVAKKNL